jgi:LemA protein
MRMRLLAVLALAATLLSGCGYNQIQINDEAVNAAWSEVLNQYKRRADLIPNLVSVVQGYASHEKEVLTRVTEARANVAGIKATPELINDPAAFAKFQKAQGELGGALARLLVVAENYPNSRPTPISATCRRSWKAPRTASPWRATATSRRCRSTTSRCAPSPTT